MVSRIALGDRPDDWEGVENIDDVQHCADRQGRTYQRHGNLEELLPIAGSVYRSRFIIACVNTLQTGKDAERNEWNRYEDTAGNLPCEICSRGRGPVYGLIYDPQTKQQGIQRTIISVDDEFPGAGLYNQCRCPWENHDSPRNLASAEFIVQHQGKYEAQYGG